MTLVIRSIGTPRQQQAYRNTIEPLLAQIRTTRTGRLLLGRLERAPRRVKIVPYGMADRVEEGPNNAIARAMNIRGAHINGAGEAGGGSGVQVHFSVGTLSNRGVGWRNDEVLCHELCHALRMVTGTVDFARVSGELVPRAMAAGFDNVEEFFAIMVTSVYSSEVGRAPRGNHGDASIRDPERLQQAPFSTRLRQFQERLPDFVRELRLIGPDAAAFNPFRDVLT